MSAARRYRSRSFKGDSAFRKSRRCEKAEHVMNLERHLTSTERLARKRAAVRARRLKSPVLRVQPAGIERRMSYRTLARVALDCGPAYEPFANDEEAMAFVQAITDELLAELDRAEGGR